MTTTTRNEAAERLRAFIDKTPSYPDVIWQHEGSELFEESLATERRVTVERIRNRLADNHNTFGAEVYRLDQIEAVLDEMVEVERPIAAERRSTVGRIRERIEDRFGILVRPLDEGVLHWQGEVLAILDEEAR